MENRKPSEPEKDGSEKKKRKPPTPAPKKKSARLIKLEAQEEAIQNAKRAELIRLSKAERDLDTRQKVLAGQAVLKEAKRSENVKKFLYNLLNSDLKEQYNRDVFEDIIKEWGMPPWPPAAKSSAPVPAAENESAPASSEKENEPA